MKKLFSEKFLNFLFFLYIEQRIRSFGGSELVIFGQDIHAIGSGAPLVSIFGGRTPLSSATKSFLGAGTKRTAGLPNFQCRVAQTLFIRSHFYNVWNSRPFFDDIIHRYSSEGCRAL